MKHIIRTVALILALCMVIPMLVGATSREDISKIQTQDKQTTSTPETKEELKLPDIVSREEAELGGFVKRLKEKETDLNTFVFKNSDGTNTMQVYSHPVKYVDEFGKIQDISLEVKASDDGSFVSASHSVTTKFEKKLSDGITLSHEDVNVKLVPKYRALSLAGVSVSDDKKQVSYPLDSKTSYVYELTYLGFKEDIVVKEYTGQTEYNFTVYTNGLSLVCEDGSYYLADDKGDIKATIGDIIVFTADERNNTFGKMTHETVRQGQEYNMTIHLDADYLKDENTLYPIRIDPTVEIVSAGTAGFIEDVTLNSTAGSAGGSSSIMVGTRSSYGISRVLMRFPALSLDGIVASDIVTATIGLRDLICQSKENFVVECRTYDISAPAWTESAPPSFATASAYIGAVHDTYTVTYNGGTSGGNWYHFDIKTAAQAWANGTQDPAKGLIFKAADSHENQTAKLWYKTFGSYNRSNYKPSLKIVYEAGVSGLPNSITIAQNETYAIQVTTNAPSVTWSSNKPGIASVDENGVVTGVNFGTAIITATFTGTDGIAISDECIVHVYMPSGMYYVFNQYSNMVLFSQSLSISDHTNVVQTVYTPNAEETRVIRQIWKITHLGENRYSIRPLYNLSMGLTYTNGNVDIVDIKTTDTRAEVIDSAEWTIDLCGPGYFIKNNGDDEKTLNLAGDGTELDGNVIAGMQYAEDKYMWTFYDASVLPTGVILYDTVTGERVTNSPKYITPGDSKTLFDMNLCAVTYPTYNQPITWTSNRTNIATVDSSTESVTAIRHGTSTIIGTLSDEEATGFIVSVPPIPEGIYFLCNKQTGYYADIENHNLTNGTKVVQHQFLGGGTQKLTFTHDGDGYYTIDIEGHYLSVKNKSINANENVEIYVGWGSVLNEATYWKISVTESGAFKLAPKEAEHLGYVLATSTSNQTNSAGLVQKAYTNDTNYCDEWRFRFPELYDVALIAVPEEGTDRSSYFSSIVTELVSIGYQNYFNNHSVVSHGWTKSYLLDFMQNSKITLIRTHGNQYGIQATDAFVTIDNVYTAELDRSELIIYGACLTANGGENAYNLVNATVNAGARTVIGFQDNVEGSACNEWCETFFEYFVQYYNDSDKDYYEVCQKTDDMLKDHDYYEGYIENKEGQLEYASLRRYVIAGEKSLPNN